MSAKCFCGSKYVLIFTVKWSDVELQGCKTTKVIDSQQVT